MLMHLSQCAWCRRAYDAGGAYGPTLDGPAGGATHGICPACAAGLLERRGEALRTAGDLRRARAIGRHLRAVLARLRARRAAGRRP
jgi:hypothetical protein